MRQVLRLFHSGRSTTRIGYWCVFAIVVFLISWAAVAQDANVEEGSMKPSFLSSVLEQERQMTEALSGQALWEDEASQKILLEYLEIAKAIRSTKAIPSLIRNIDYSPQQQDGAKHRLPIDKRLPAYAALVEIGLPAVRGLLSGLKDCSAQNDLSYGRDAILDAKRGILVSCLVAIYDRAGHGVLLAEGRLKLELAATKDDKEKANLQAALDHPIFKEADATAGNAEGGKKQDRPAN